MICAGRMEKSVLLRWWWFCWNPFKGYRDWPLEKMTGMLSLLTDSRHPLPACQSIILAIAATEADACPFRRGGMHHSELRLWLSVLGQQRVGWCSCQRCLVNLSVDSDQAIIVARRNFPICWPWMKTVSAKRSSCRASRKYARHCYLLLQCGCHFNWRFN